VPRPDWLEPVFRDLDPVFIHGMTTAAGPDLKTDPASEAHAAAVSVVAAELGIDAVAWARQVHGGVVLRVDGPGCAGEADALWTDRPGLAVIGRSADCPIVSAAGRRADGKPMWGMAHASWRSTVAGITGGLLEAMIADGLEPETVRAAIAPSAGPCCYEVGDEVRDAMVGALGEHASTFFVNMDTRSHLDLWAANSDALMRCGVTVSQILVDGRCTICGTKYPSYRRQGAESGRFGVLIGARSTPAL